MSHVLLQVRARLYVSVCVVMLTINVFELSLQTQPDISSTSDEKKEKLS